MGQYIELWKLENHGEEKAEQKQTQKTQNLKISVNICECNTMSSETCKEQFDSKPLLLFGHRSVLIKFWYSAHRLGLSAAYGDTARRVMC